MVEIKSDSLWVLSREKNAPKMASEPVLLLVIGLDCAEDTETLVLIVTGVLLSEDEKLSDQFCVNRRVKFGC